jgi:hypothetical protein
MLAPYMLRDAHAAELVRHADQGLNGPNVLGIHVGSLKAGEGAIDLPSALWND